MLTRYNAQTPIRTRVRTLTYTYTCLQNETNQLCVPRSNFLPRALSRAVSFLQCHISFCCSVLQHVVACCSVLQRVAACCSVLQRHAACYSVLQRGIVCFLFSLVCLHTRKQRTHTCTRAVSRTRARTLSCLYVCKACPLPFPLPFVHARSLALFRFISLSLAFSRSPSLALPLSLSLVFCRVRSLPLVRSSSLSRFFVLALWLTLSPSYATMPADRPWRPAGKEIFDASLIPDAFGFFTFPPF